MKMKKILCVILSLSMLLAAVPALASDYADISLLPAHVRQLVKEFEAGDYGDEVYQAFIHDPVDFRGCV